MSSPSQLVSSSEDRPAVFTLMKARIPQHVVYRSLVSETVMLNVQSGKYYGLNQTAGRMLEILDRGIDLDTAVTQLANEFEAPEETVRRDLLALCADLAERGLLELDQIPAPDAE